MSRYIEFKDLKESKVSLVGKRAAILADLYKSGYPVQKGIIVVSKIFKEFLVENEIAQELFSFLKSGDFEKAQELVNGVAFPNELRMEILEAAQSLNVESFSVSLSSSFDDEFGCFNIQFDKIPEWIQRCWASVLREDNAEQFKSKNWYPAVIIQPQLDVQKAGTFYTINPAKMENNRMVIEIVSPRQAYIIIDKRKGDVVSNIDFKSNSSLFLEELNSLVKLSRDIEKHYRFPQKIDWIFNERFVITNARKLTDKDKDHFLSQATSSLLRSRVTAT